MKFFDWFKRLGRRRRGGSGSGANEQGPDADLDYHLPFPIRLDSVPTTEWKKERILVLETGVAGLTYRLKKYPQTAQILVNTIQPGKRLRLVRELNNDTDPWAIAVYTRDNFKLGYITRYKNEPIARMMDSGVVFLAMVSAPIEPNIAWAPTEDYRVPVCLYMEVYR